MKTTRQRIIDLLETQRQATPAEIGRSLSVPAANIRHHLKILEDEGAAQVVGERRSPGRGRPQRLYASTRQAGQHNYDLLSSVLLTQSLHSLGEEQHPAFLKEIASRLLDTGPAHGDSRQAPTSAGAPGSGKALASRLVIAVQRLNQLHYEAHWEAHIRAPRIIFTHCPYRTLVDGHPQLCQLDAALLQSLTGRPVAQIEKLAQDRRGIVRCVFSLETG